MTTLDLQQRFGTEETRREFALKRITISKQMRGKLREVKDELRRRRHLLIPEQGLWLGSVMRGHLAYYAVPGNSHCVRHQLRCDSVARGSPGTLRG